MITILGHGYTDKNGIRSSEFQNFKTLDFIFLFVQLFQQLTTVSNLFTLVCRNVQKRFSKTKRNERILKTVLCQNYDEKSKSKMLK